MGNETRTRIMVALVPIVSACCFVACCQGCGEPEEHRNERLRKEHINSLARDFYQHVNDAESSAKRKSYDDAIDEYTTAIDLHKSIVKEGGLRKIGLRRVSLHLERGLCYYNKCMQQYQLRDVQLHQPDVEPLPPDAQKAIADFSACIAEVIDYDIAYYWRAKFYMEIHYSSRNKYTENKYLDMAIADYRRAVEISADEDPDSKDHRRYKAGLKHALKWKAERAEMKLD
jgi:tetratricopeptide (TPR) repeat protein